MANHICTNCTTPTTSLYKIYSTPGSIQLTTCKKCGRDVDPYIEREWLLVIMDCVLHRPEAFRHVLYNREPFCDLYSSGRLAAVKQRDGHEIEKEGDVGKDSTTINDSSRSNNISSLKRLIRYSIAASFLRSYLWYMAKGAGRDNSDLMPEAIISITQSLLGEIILVITTILSGSFYFNNDMTSESNESRNDPTSKNAISSKTFFYSRLHLALSIPVYFYIATMFALIWENSLTVCLLGTLFVLSLQRMAVSVVIEERVISMKNATTPSRCEKEVARVSPAQRSMTDHLMHSLPLIIGLLTRTIFVHIIGGFMAPVIGVDGSSLECTGIPIPISNFVGSAALCVV